MSYVIKRENLLIGDILLIKTNDRTCEKIREYSKSNFSHALIYRGNSSCLESNALGVASVNPQRLLFQNIDDLCVLRLKDLSLLPKLEIGLINSSSKVGMGYSSRRELMKSYLETLEKAEEENRQFCTRLVSQIYFESGIDIVQNPDYCSPKDIENSELLEKVDDMLKEASLQEIELAQEENNILSIQTDALFTIFEKIREISNVDIQTFDQIDDFLIQNPEFDEAFNTIVKDSKYFDLGNLEKEKNILMYNPETFLKYYGVEQCVQVSLSQIQGEKHRIINFSLAIKKYTELYDQTKLQYFKSHIDCYIQNLELSKERLFVWETIINKFCV
ncbi:hypothetical protein [Flavobacterium sp.]|uniref:hypothetical protein n=1 Tax=Flavobacterium sp. TaxID=239 RepID=UPI00262E2898|nr:hypothetical protein [Flavobacterium sp.]